MNQEKLFEIALHNVPIVQEILAAEGISPTQL